MKIKEAKKHEAEQEITTKKLEREKKRQERELMRAKKEEQKKQKAREREEKEREKVQKRREKVATSSRKPKKTVDVLLISTSFEHKIISSFSVRCLVHGRNRINQPQARYFGTT